MPVQAVGRKDETLARAIKSRQRAKPLVGYYVGKKPFPLGGEVLQPGDEIPEAAQFPRVESLIRAGLIVEGPPNELEPQHMTFTPPSEPRFVSGFPKDREEALAAAGG